MQSFALNVINEEQIIFKSNQNKSQTIFKKLMQWITK